jgi:murein L,D-transpeptidase YafK
MVKSVLRIGAAVFFVCSLAYGGYALINHTRLKFYVFGKKTVQDRLREYGPAARSRVSPLLEKNGIGYPPSRIALICLKQERRIELWCANKDGAHKHIKDYPILGMSGKQGPKLAQGDYQVPEGLYRVESLNPNSLFHLALRVSYPNDFDVRMGRQDHREDLGSDIMIHGSTCSVGCLAMGDPAIEELFTLVAEADLENVAVLLCPMDFRANPISLSPNAPSWVAELYTAIQTALKPYA